MSETLVILNPAAHGAKAAQHLQLIKELANGSKIAVSEKAGDARRLAEEGVKQGFRKVVAAGGDGTINEVVNGLAGSEVSLGVLPVGTMNVFAAEVGLPVRIREAWNVIHEGHTRKVDLATVNGQYFIQLAGAGLDAQVVKETTWDMKRTLGPLSYLISAARIAARKPPRLVVEADGRVEEGSFVLIGNGRYYGGRFQFFREAQIDDGLLDVLVFKNMGHLDIARYFATVLVGRHTSLSDVISFQAKEVRITSDEEVPVEVDGELASQLPATFAVADTKLNVLVPDHGRGLID